MGQMTGGKGDTRPPGPYQGYLNERCRTIAEVLKTAGYTTLMSGKWHVGESRPHWPLDRGFDRYYGLISGAANYFDIKKVNTSIYECLIEDADPRKIIMKSEIETLDLIPSHIDLVGAEIEMLNMNEREYMLKKVIEQVEQNYDYVLIDCSPSLGLITVNALTAADSVIIPVQCEYFALEGLGKLLNTINIIQRGLNPDLEIEGFLLTMYDGRLRLSNQVVEEVRKHFQQMVFETIIQRNIKLSEAPSFGKPAILYDAECRGSVSYLNLAREILQKNEETLLKQAEKVLD
jgi:chromosome partitioning protein